MRVSLDWSRSLLRPLFCFGAYSGIFQVAFVLAAILVGTASVAQGQGIARFRQFARGTQTRGIQQRETRILRTERVPSASSDVVASARRRPTELRGTVASDAFQTNKLSAGESSSRGSSAEASPARQADFPDAAGRLIDGDSANNLAQRAEKADEKVVLKENGLSPLAYEDGEYRFIAVVRRDELKTFSEETGCFRVFVPRSNFIAPVHERVNEADDASSSQLSSSGDSAELSALRETSASHANTVDEYVVFTLTNLDPQEERLLRDSADGKWDDFDLLDASLIAEGLTSTESRSRYRSRFESLVSLMLQQTEDVGDPLLKTEIVYNFLHSRALYSKYDLTCSSVAAALDSGVFNCVSATALFNCFAERAGLEVASLETTGHAKSRVKFEDAFLDVETTCSSWSRLPDKTRPYQSALASDETLADDGSSSSEFRARGNETFDAPRRADATLNYVALKSESSREDRAREDGSTTFRVDETAPLGYSFTRSRRPMREITNVELVATMYYNVGVDFSQTGDYERSIASYIKAAQLAPDNKTILGNLKATLNNWAIDVAVKQGDYETAIHITDLGREIDPDFREFKMNAPIFFHDWIDSLTKSSDWDGVKRARDEYRKRFPEE